MRGLAHWLIMWGCVCGGGDHVPAGLGLDSFPDRARQTSTSTAPSCSDFPVQDFPVDSLVAFVVFHGLVWASFLVIAGVMLAFRRRMIDHGAVATQQFGQDVLPLVLLFAISVTGLMLTASYTWMKGYAYDFLAILHAAHRDLHAAVSAVREALPHFPAARAARGELLQGGRRTG